MSVSVQVCNCQAVTRHFYGYSGPGAAGGSGVGGEGGGRKSEVKEE